MRPNPYSLPAPATAYDRVAGNGYPNGNCGPRSGYPNGYTTGACPPVTGIPGAGPDNCDSIVGFLDAAVETATQTTITITPQDCGIVERLVATDAAENTFQLDDFLVGRSSAFGAVPLSFASLKSDSTVRCMKTVGSFGPGKTLSLIATNFTGGTARLSANAHYTSTPS